jgi:hypothetical protein
MADTLNTFTKLIRSPPGQLAAGGVLAGIVWKFFERVEAVLTENTKLEIAVWLLNMKVGQKVEPWPETFASIFDKVFGKKHFSWTCFWRSCVALAGALGPSLLAISTFNCFVFAQRVTPTLRTNSIATVLLIFGCSLFGNFIPDFLSLLKGRVILGGMRTASTLEALGLPALDLLMTVVLATASLYIVGYAFFTVGQRGERFSVEVFEADPNNVFTKFVNLPGRYFY